MKILLLSDPNSPHTIKWATSLAINNNDVLIFGLGRLTVNVYNDFKNIEVITLNQSINRNEGAFSKLKYLFALPKIKRAIKKFQPDILHSHYATGYGLLGALTNFSPYILSVWGSDVFNFPHISFIHSQILKYNLRRADKILSTSHVMAEETKLYTDKNIEVTPFGIDLDIFKPQQVESLFQKNDFVVGTIKTLEHKYGIEYLIRAFKITSDKFPSLPLKLLIVGGGSLEKQLKSLVKELDLTDKTIFTGQIPFDQIPRYHNMLDVSVSVSVSNCESFGVAIIEASACEKPVIVSNIGGLPEVVEKNVTGLIVEPKNVIQTADAIEKLVTNREFAQNLGIAGRKRVTKIYNWNDNVDQMLSIYKNYLSK